jgi:hypothetical protein
VPGVLEEVATASGAEAAARARALRLAAGLRPRKGDFGGKAGGSGTPWTLASGDRVSIDWVDGNEAAAPAKRKYPKIFSASLGRPTEGR